jgi:hypothetical protein
MAPNVPITKFKGTGNLNIAISNAAGVTDMYAYLLCCNSKQSDATASQYSLAKVEGKLGEKKSGHSWGHSLF